MLRLELRFLTRASRPLQPAFPQRFSYTNDGYIADSIVSKLEFRCGFSYI
jgi:hypothetical protein